MGSSASFVDFIDSVVSGQHAPAASVAGEPQRASSSTLTRIAFQRGDVGLIDVATPQGRTWSQVLTSLQQSGAPAYVEVDPVNSLITKVLLPHVVRIGAIKPIGDGVEVALVHGCRRPVGWLPPP